MPLDNANEDTAVADVVERLSVRFPHASRALIAELVHDALTRFEHARVRDFVPVLVEREARARLEDLAPSAG